MARDSSGFGLLLCRNTARAIEKLIRELGRISDETEKPDDSADFFEEAFEDPASGAKARCKSEAER